MINLLQITSNIVGSMTNGFNLIYTSVKKSARLPKRQTGR